MQAVCITAIIISEADRLLKGGNVELEAHGQENALRRVILKNKSTMPKETNIGNGVMMARSRCASDDCLLSVERRQGYLLI